MSDKQPRVALITGGSAGIGLACARRFARQGDAVVIAARDPDRIRAAVDDIRTSADGADVHGLPADLADGDAAERAVAATVARHGRLDIVVNSAGATPPGRFDEVPMEHWRSAYELKVLGAVRVMRAALPHMTRQRYGRMISIAGIAGKEPDELTVLGGVVNAGLTTVTRAAARQVAPLGITVNAVNPGPTTTQRWDGLARVYAAAWEVDPDTARQRLAADIPTGRPAQPDEVAALVAYLAGDEAAHVTGCSLDIDGGQLRGT